MRTNTPKRAKADRTMLKPSIQLAAKELQLLVRIEEAASQANVHCVVGGEYTFRLSPFGHCVCVTCGTLLPYKSPSWEGNQMQGGHFIAGRSKKKAVMLEEMNVHPQCSGCNKGDIRNAQANYLMYMVQRYGLENVEKLILRGNVHPPPSAEEIIEKRKDFRKRIQLAKQIVGRFYPDLTSNQE